MSDFDYSPDKKLTPSEQLKDLQNKESRSNLLILFRDKEIMRLKSHLNEIESKIAQNKKSYSSSNTKSSLLHHFVIEEFELYKRELQENHQKICSLVQENFFKRNSEGPGTSALLKHAVDYMERTNKDIQGELTQEKIGSLHQTFEKKLKNVAELEQKLKESRAYIKHLENDISETDDLIMLLSAKTKEVELQCQEMRSENLRLTQKSKNK